MAENEILDVGNQRRYKRWRQVLCDNTSNPAQVAEALEEGLKDALRKKLRGKSLHLVLKACDLGKDLLQAAVDSLKDRQLAKMVERARAASRSSDPSVVASSMADMMIDSVIDRANKFAFKHLPEGGGVRHASLESAARSRLEACRPQIVAELEASLRNVPIRREPVRRTKASPQDVASMSLVQAK